MTRQEEVKRLIAAREHLLKLLSEDLGDCVLPLATAYKDLVLVEFTVRELSKA